MKNSFNIKGIFNRLSFLVLVLLFSGLAVQAQNFKIENNDLIEPTEAEEEETKSEPDVVISGGIDGYYQYNFQESVFPTSFTEAHDAFMLGMANLVFAKISGKIEMVADLGFGPRAEVANGTEGVLLGAIKQLYVKYQATEKLGVTFGNFSTFLGYEVIDAKDNLNYSTSYLFSNGPFFHTGLKVDYAFNDNFSAMVGLFNDTDSKLESVGGKHFGAQLSYIDDKTGVYLNYIAGPEDLSGDLVSDGSSSQIDLTATFQATEAFGLGLNSSIKSISSESVDESDNWIGTALYLNYAFSDAFTLAFRGEQIIDNDGLISGVLDNSITSLTLSGNINLNDIVIIPEFRIDSGKNDATFFNGDFEPTDQLASFLVAVHYSF